MSTQQDDRKKVIRQKFIEGDTQAHKDSIGLKKASDKISLDEIVDL